MAAETDEAICLRHWEWSETSQTVALFARGHGVVRALAKGSRRPKAPYSGGVELLTVAEIGFIARPQSELALLTYWDLRRTFPALRNSLFAHNAGMYLADMVLQFVRDHDPHPALYDAALLALERTDAPTGESGTIAAALLGFQSAMLDECGFRPQLMNDARTGDPLAPLDEYLFHPELGGLIAPNDTAPPGGWRVRSETVDLLRAVASGEPTESAAEVALDRGNRLLASYARHILGYQTSTMTALFRDRLAQ